MFEILSKNIMDICYTSQLCTRHTVDICTDMHNQCEKEDEE